MTDRGFSAIDETQGGSHMLSDKDLYPADAERYRGLAQMYVSDSRFAAHYNTAAPGPASFLCAAMNHFASTRPA
ncbi:MAG: hypothetical protein E4H09_04230 [Spirochaetales bacterium]|nr:MAG: hypothetical protein E4H09_04230 [Spirochaetales bacterium]